jgi:hypothetical protein
MKSMSSRSSLVGCAWVIAVLGLAGCGGGGASNDGASNGNANGSSGGETGGGGSAGGGSAGAAEPTFPMPLPNFLGAVTAEVLPDLCSDASPLRTCYPSIDAQVCATAFSTAMMSCGENMQSSLPAEVTEETADPVATAVATCARMAYQLGLEQAGAARAADCPLAR